MRKAGHTAMLDYVRRAVKWQLLPSYLPMKSGCYTISFVPQDPVEETRKFTFAVNDAGTFEDYDEPPAFVRAFARSLPEELNPA